MSTKANPSEPLENSVQYEDICKIVGTLYLDSFRRVQTVEAQASTMIEHLRAQNSTLIKEMEELEADIEKRNGI